MRSNSFARTPMLSQIFSGYESYLLRLWRTRQSGKTSWRASLESTRTGICRNFATLDELHVFLQVQGHSERKPPRLPKSTLRRTRSVRRRGMQG
jgi:hypothetical protein